jgi:hypothetical protein
VPAWKAPDWRELFDVATALARALDCVLWQTRRLTGEPGALCDTPMAVLEALRGLCDEPMVEIGDDL